MTRLNDTQLTILSAAAQRGNLAVALPDSLSDDERAKLAKALLRKALVEEVPAKGRMPVYRLDEDGRKISLVIAAAGLAAIGVTDEPSSGNDPARRRPAQASAKAAPSGKRGRKADAAAAAPKGRLGGGASPDERTPSRQAPAATLPAQPDGNAPRPGSKLAAVIALLARADGASVEELMAATGWLAHTTRAALTGLRRRGYVVTREPSEAGASVYRIIAVDARARAA